jgi:UDP-N-acetylmuramate--alanine ligase
MSAIAKVLIERGAEVSGSDLKRSRVATMLEAMGAAVHIGHDPALVEGAASVVVSAAIPESNPEYRRAKELGIEIVTRGAALAQVLEGARSIVIAGTHGKTTTTSMVTTVLGHAEMDPTYLIGAGLNDIGTNARAGSSDIAVAEADESDGSFLLLSPYVAVVTNIELDHVDHWGTIDELRGAFERFLDQGPSDGWAVLPVGEAALIERARRRGQRTVTFGPGGDVDAGAIAFEPGGTRFKLGWESGSAEVELRVPGLHNVYNATTAAAACSAIGCSLEQVAEGLAAYRGVERRFQVKGTSGGVTVIDDYAHHPTEVRATLAAARNEPYERIVVVFQPHRYSRTAALAGEFGSSFADADHVVLMDVYGAGELPVPGVSGRSIADAIAAAGGRSVEYFPHREGLVDHLIAVARPGDALLTLGAGDVTTVGEELLARLGPA